ncbi:MAG TPA: hypothetical protein VGG08_04750 [Solirubrobacteraceae bacterium]|jgi:hypothetical protein
MTLQRIHDTRAFDDATDDERRARVYVGSRELGLPEADRPETELMRALAEDPAPQRLHVVGPSGAGKTSLILRVVADLLRREMHEHHEVLILRVGDRPDRLGSPEEVMKMVLETIAVEGHRFSSIDQDKLLAAAADEVTRTPTQVEHQAGITAPVVNYQATIKEAYQTAGFGQNAAQVRHDLEDILGQVRGAGFRPVLVLDDTEKFVSPGPEGAVDRTSVENLYHHGVRVLGEMQLDLVVAMHPRFEDVERVTEVVQRLGLRRINVPNLPADADAPALSRILERRMERDGIQDDLDNVIELAAIEDLQVLYHERDQDLRSVLTLAHSAARRALLRGGTRIEAKDVRTVVAKPQP